MKRILAVILTLVMTLGLVSSIWAAGSSQVAYAVTGGNIYFDPSTGAIVGCDKSVTEAVIPSEINGVKVASIGQNAFWAVSNLKSIKISEGVSDIGSSAFYYCTGLKSVEIPDSVVNINSSAFSGCTSLESIVLPKNLAVITSHMLANCTSLKAVTIPHGVTTISDNAFSGCSSLTSINIPDSVASLGDGAFKNTGLTSVYIPKSVTKITVINASIFTGCEKLSKIDVDSENPAYQSIDGVLFTKASNTELVCYPAGKTDAAYSIPDGTIGISYYAFAGNKNISSITIPSDCSLGSYNYNNIFAGCTNLTAVSLPITLAGIPNMTFDQCNRITDVYYGGCADRWSKLSIGSYNGSLSSANIHFDNSDHLISGIELEVGKTGTFAKFDSVQGSISYSYVLLYQSEPIAQSDKPYSGSFYPAPVSLTIPYGTSNLPMGGSLYDYVIEVYASGQFIGSAVLGDWAPHEHVFTDEWFNNAISHWHKCEQCSEIADESDHTYSKGVCIVCEYVVKNLPPDADYTPGDLNGDGRIDSTDSVLLLRYLVGLTGNVIEKAADYNLDGEVDSLDSVMLLRRLVGLE